MIVVIFGPYPSDTALTRWVESFWTCLDNKMGLDDLTRPNLTGLKLCTRSGQSQAGELAG